ncbi:folate transporter 1 isoform X2 [Acyrthosiphon pisum]|uniref:Reduced folate carrier,Major facilitator superfamily domain n=1 Tax=Acyrthosiphon pisum TaxID=7029 RepID=A0A8R2H761_ACYPI|nr:folate transporter 1 isoform X2 [Acyrthosiphon pisum]|eukprot:XP_016660496.1 PREDICTED: folate transporter 1 isoform X2 [Acyrthosiphon pisum]
MTWKTISLCLCIYGVLKEFRPSESYFIPYLLSPRMNFTEEQVNNEILSIGVYASMIFMIFVSLTTDWLRYKIVIVIQALCGVCIYALLSLFTSFTSIVVVEILYGLFVATEVAYYTYTYSVVNVKYYQKVTSYTRAAHLIGRFFSGFLSQVFISTKLVDTYQLNFLTLGSLTAAMMWTITLPAVKRSEPKSETQKMNVIDRALETKLEDEDNDLAENSTEHSKMSWKYLKSMCKEYKSLYILKWSFWVITATCCFNQVLYYIQSLWESLSNDECLQSSINNCTKTSEWNGAVDAVYTIIVTSFIQFAALYISIAYSSIYISYINYIIYCAIYQGMMTIASSEIAKCVNKDNHGFVFGVNNLLAATLQSLATFFMTLRGLSSSSKILFEWYAIFCLVIGVCYLFLSILQVVKK